jgi:tetratricopeptide (TPR) repeat protein
MTTRFRSAGLTSLVLIVGLSLASGACGKYSYSSLKARKAFKDGNVMYGAQDWKRAAEKYEEVLANDPNYNEALFYLANSYDNLYKPARAGEAQNDANIQKAIENYKKAAEKDPKPEMRTLAMQYLVAAYGPEKLNNPAESEPIVKRMIELEPGSPENYFALAKIYQDAGRYEEAEQALMKAKEIKPNDPAVYTALSNFYNQQGEFEKTMDALSQAANLAPNNPQGFQLMATFYWEKAYKDKRLSPAQQKEYIAKGIESTDKALALNKDYAEALTYKNILLRMQAHLAKDPAKQQQLIKEADELKNRAMALMKSAKTGN